MTRYRVIGRPNVPFDVLTDRVIGDEIEADLDKDEEALLLGVGALVKLPAKKAPSHSKSSGAKEKE